MQNRQGTELAAVKMCNNPVTTIRAKTTPYPISHLTSLGLVVVLGLTSVGVMANAIVPAAAHAYVSRINVVLDVQPGETFETFLSRAEGVARAAVQRSFNRDILITEVYAIVVAQKNGGSVQVLSIQVSRNQWRNFPDPHRWATYYQNAKFLLGFGGSPATR
jgi:hypothetical protein